MAEFSLRGISKTYPGGIHAVRQLDLEIRERDFIVFVGPSGCGKTTTLRMIAGLEGITAGDLLMNGKRINDLAPRDRDLAMVFQNYALYPHMSIYDNIAFGLKLRRMPKAEIRRRIEEAARMLEIERLLDRKPKSLSGGQRQRVAMGRAIVRNPNAFLLDEPLSNLDAALRDQIRTELIGLHQKLGATFIYVTHDQTEAMTLGTRIVIMKDGVVQQADTPEVVYSRPGNKFVAGFIGSPQMNFVNATVEKHEERVGLRFGANLVTVPKEAGDTLLEAGYEGREIVFGIRPEHISVRPLTGTAGDDHMPADKEIVEMRGADSLLHVSCGGVKLSVRADSSVCRELGSRCAIQINAEKLHLFDMETEERLERSHI
jgi:multiple sugar transport system ATP-binding protein